MSLSPRIGNLSHTHNKLLQTVHGHLNQHYLHQKQDKAVALLDKLYVHTTQRINHTFSEIEETLKQCKHEQPVTHSNITQIRFGHGTATQRRKSAQCVLTPSNHYTYHYHLTFNMKLTDTKLTIKCCCEHSEINVYLNDITKATRHNNTLQSVHRDYHYLILQANEMKNIRELYICVTIAHKDKEKIAMQIAEFGGLCVSMQFELVRNMNNCNVITSHHIKQDLKHRILTFQQQRAKQKILSATNVVIPVAVPKQEMEDEVICDQADNKNIEKTENKLAPKKCEIVLPCSIIDVKDIPKLDIACVLQHGKDMRVPLSTSRIRGAMRVEQKLRRLQQFESDRICDIQRNKRQLKKRNDIRNEMSLLNVSSDIPMISPRFSPLVDRNGKMILKQQIKAESLNAMIGRLLRFS